MKCNFKVILSNGKAVHVYRLNVICNRHEEFGYFYTVEGQVHESYFGLLLSSKSAGTGDIDTFRTPEEAFSFADKISEKYPRYGDDRDYDIALAPLYEGVEM